MADRDLNHLQPQFRTKVEAWFLRLQEAEIRLHVAETLRSFGRSAQLYAQGRTEPGKIVTNAKPGQSYHNYGLALDVYPIGFDGKPEVNFDKHRTLMAVMRTAANLAMQYGIVWGGSWPRFLDLPHFQDKDAPALAECRKAWPEGWKVE